MDRMGQGQGQGNVAERVVAGEREWSRIERLLDEALDLDRASRAAWLAGQPVTTEQREEVQALLAAHDRQGILDHEIPATALEETDADDVARQLTRAFHGRYEVLRLLGEGGSATVYLAHEAKHDRDVVLKVLKDEVAAWVGTERFRAEIRILAQLQDPRIVPLLDSGEVDGHVYFVMPYLGGETLRDRLRRGPMDPAEGRELLMDVAHALSTAHCSVAVLTPGRTDTPPGTGGLVHRDLKPANILCVDRHAYLMDFGIARVDHPAPGAGHTLEGVALGTPDYMSPEQRAGRPVDARSDVYAWGLVAREVLDVSPADARTPALRALVRDCLHEDPSRRPAHGGELLERMIQIQEGRSFSWHRILNRGSWLVGGAAVVGVVLWGMRTRGAAIDAEEMPVPVVVSPLRNETGDSTLAVWGRMAGDWLTQGLLASGNVPVVPWPVALQAAGHTVDSSDAIGALMRETRARAVLSGAYYLVGDRIQFQAQLSDASGAVLGTLPPVEVARDSMAWGIQDLRERLRGMIAVRDDNVRAFAPVGRPPLFAAYQDFERGITAYNAQRYDEAILALQEAWRRDSTFDAAVVYLGRALWNAGHRRRVDSLTTAVRARSIPMSPYLDAQLRYLEHVVAGNGAQALAAIREAAARAPGGRDGYNVAGSALAIGQPAEAERALRALDPDRGALKSWAPYWYTLTHALHQQGRFADEWKEAIALRGRFPQSRPSWVHLVRAAAAVGRTASIDSVLALAAPEAPDTYWSQGAVMVTAAEELEAHGFADRAPAYYARAEKWLANQLARNPTHDAHRYWMGSALYDQGRWEDAWPYFESLRAQYPDELRSRGPIALILARRGDLAAARVALGEAAPFQETEHLVYRARLAGIAGDAEASLGLWQQAVARGYSSLVWQHHASRRDLMLLEGNPVARQLGLVVR